MQPTATSSRIHTMDSLRGLASLQVLLHHCLLMSGVIYAASDGGAGVSNVWVKAFTFSPAHIFWTGHEAVIFFFVMSGFVLSIPFYKEKGGSYFSFVLKRIFRIYAPYMVALCIGIICNAYFNQHQRIESLSSWFNDFYSKPVSKAEAVDFIFLMKGYFHNVVTSLWSLPVELKLSLLFPFIAILFKRASLGVCILIPFLNMAFFHGGKRLGFELLWKDFALLYYLSFFLFGACLSKYHQPVLRFFSKLKTGQWAWLLAVVVLLYTYAWTIQMLPQNIFFYAVKIPADYAVCVASILIIIIGTSQKFERILSHKYLVELGRASFSLYLIHPIIIGVLGFTLGNLMPVYLLILLSVVLSLVAAFPFHYLVEWPLQKLGRKISQRFENSSQRSALYNENSQKGLPQTFSHHPSLNSRQ